MEVTSKNNYHQSIKGKLICKDKPGESKMMCRGMCKE